jgi:hypothetical protein
LFEGGSVRVETPELVGFFPGEDAVGFGFVDGGGKFEFWDAGRVCVVGAGAGGAGVGYLLESESVNCANEV